ncbi:HEAT repeats containing protein [Halalkaliarchaeum sp. AArc-CO]|uniref:HEAT repeat domain-containing protein n=1 Tax=unclassified Halalkaliarchaeum TaxID=2678344 RepID=UPI00217D82FB|nr:MULTISPECIES: adaptin [unclassified Halalkaliarchaeum]MDR5673021.1 adaptin [Halalkaliarchaeum sp. AArc-GB]UWG49500.1 HEAT repeats containing protein [Halalkaliarchaeum sp. AArc-CO]
MPAPGPGPDARPDPETEGSTDRPDRTDGGAPTHPSFDQVQGLVVDPDDVPVRTTADGAAGDSATDRYRTDDDGIRTESGSEETSLSPREYAVRVHELVYRDPTAAGDRVGDLLVLASEGDPDVREMAGETLAWLGERRPREFEVWADDLAAFADRREPELSYLGIRALAQLGSCHEDAAAKGLEPAIRRLGSDHEDLRAASLALVAEVGHVKADAIGDADRPIAAAMEAASERIRTGAAIAAGNLLAATPQRFPRTSMALVDTLSDPDDGVRTYAHVALVAFAREHPSVVPDKETALSALEATDDAELGLKDGAVAEAENALLRELAGFR